MSLKPLQTAKHVGVRWVPNPEVVQAFLEPLVEPRQFEQLRRSGRIVLDSVYVDDWTHYYDRRHVTDAGAQLNAYIQQQWPARRDVHASIDGIAWKYEELHNAYRFKYHLEQPYAKELRKIIAGKDNSQAPHRQHMQESVYFTVPVALLPHEVTKDPEYIEHKVAAMRGLLAEQALKASYWLEKPHAYVVTYRPEEAAILNQPQVG